MKHLYTPHSKYKYISLLWTVMMLFAFSGVRAQSTWVLFPADVTVECDNIPAVATIGVDVTGSQGCGGGMDIIYLGETRINGACPDSYTLRRRWWLFDFTCGPIVSNIRDQFITVQDTTRPTFTAPVLVTVYRNGACGIDTTVAATGNVTGQLDNCTAAGSLVILRSDNTTGLTGCNNTGTIVRTWSVRDACNNTTVKTQTILVSDTTKPVISCQNISRMLSLANGTTSIVASDVLNAVSDNCTPVPSVVLSLSKWAFNCSNLGANTIYLKATDACGNADSCAAIVTINYTTKPVSSSSIKGDTLCNGQNVSFVLSSNIPVTTYTWTITKTVASMTGVSNGSSATMPTTVIQTPSNKIDSVNSVIYHIQPNTYGCNDSAFNILIKVNPTPSLTFTIPDTFICNHGTAIFTMNSNLDNNILGDKFYQIQRNYNPANLSGIGVDGYFAVAGFSETYTNSSSVYQTIQYRIDPVIRDPKGTNPNYYCTGGTQIIKTVYALADVQPNLTSYKYIGGNDISCFGTSTGQLTLTVEGGYIGFNGFTQDNCTFAWSNGSTIRSPQNIPAGIYSVNITDGKGCTANSSITLTQPPILTTTLSDVSLPTCRGAANGSVRVNISGGTPGYDSYWTGPVSYPPTHAVQINNMFDGRYDVLVTDTNGCKASNLRIITSSTPVNFNFFPKSYGTYQVSCRGAIDGGFQPFSVSGGQELFIYECYDSTRHFMV